MYKATILYRQPADRVAFEEHYWKVHVPLAAKMPGLRRWTITRTESANGPNESLPFCLVVELFADDRASLFAAFSSPEGQAAAADVRSFAGDDVLYLFGTEEEVPFSGQSAEVPGDQA